MSYVVQVTFVLVIILILGLTVFLFVKLYSKIKSSDKDNFNLIQFPKETNKKIDDFILETKHNNDQLRQFIQSEYQTAKKIISDIDEKISPFEKVAREKNDELKKYKEGYEYSRNKALIEGVIDTIHFIENSKEKINSSDEVTNSYIDSFKDKLLIILNNSGIETFSPTLNTSSLDNIGCEVDAVTEITSEKNKNNLIFSVLKKGYRIQLKQNDYFYIKKALVKVYEHKEQ